MTKKFTLALTLLIGASCIPMQAARTPWTVTKDSAKVLVSVWLVWNGGNAVINSLSSKARKKMRTDFDKARAEGREQVKKQGGNVEQYDEIMEVNAKIVGWMPVVSGVVGAGMAAGGLWLGYRGLQGLFATGANVERV